MKQIPHTMHWGISILDLFINNSHKSNAVDWFIVIYNTSVHRTSLFLLNENTYM